MPVNPNPGGLGGYVNGVYYSPNTGSSSSSGSSSGGSSSGPSSPNPNSSAGMVALAGANIPAGTHVTNVTQGSNGNYIIGTSTGGTYTYNTNTGGTSYSGGGGFSSGGSSSGSTPSDVLQATGQNAPAPQQPQNYGTYNPTTGIYVGPSGQPQSMAKAPPNATIIGGVAGSGNRDYTGGGYVNQTYLPPLNVEQGTTQAQLIQLKAMFPDANGSELLDLARGYGIVETPQGIKTPTSQQAYQNYVQNRSPEQKLIFNDQGDVVGYDEGGKSYSYAALDKIMPKSGYVNVRTGSFIETDSNPGKNQIDSYLFKKAYLNPKTGKVFESNAEFGSYLKNNNIPLANNAKPKTLQEAFQRLEKTYADYSEERSQRLAEQHLVEVTTKDGRKILMQSGEASPVFKPSEMAIYSNKHIKEQAARIPGGLTAFDIASIIAPVGKVIGGGVKLARPLTMIFSKEITAPLDYAYEKTYQPKSQLGMFAKASIFAVPALMSPTLSSSYGINMFKSIVNDPVNTWNSLKQQVTQRPGELAGFMVGGSLLKKGFDLAEFKLRGGTFAERVLLPNYGEVFIMKIPKFKDIVWVKGGKAASEKIDIMDQINRLKGDKERVYVQVSSQGIPMQIFSNTKNLGFEVRQLQNPERGLYQAPPMQFLEAYSKILKTNYGALSYYAGGLKRDSILPNPVEAFRGLLTNAKTTLQRPFTYLERTFKEVKTPTWIESVAKSLKENSKIDPRYTKLIDKYYNIYLKKPLVFNGKTYVGLEKQKLVNEINLRSKGDGLKLKVYSALVEYQNSNKVKLVGGPEVLSGIKPFGPEHQLVRAIGTRFFVKSLKDLRKGVKSTITSKILDLITGTKRGEHVVSIQGSLVEIQPFRSFEGRIKRTSSNIKSESTVERTAKFDKKDVSQNIVDMITGKRRIREEQPREFRKPARPLPLKSQDNQRRIDDRNSRFRGFFLPTVPVRVNRSIPREENRRENNLNRAFDIIRSTREPQRELNRSIPIRNNLVPRRQPPREQIRPRPANDLNRFISNRKPEQPARKKKAQQVVRKRVTSITLPTAFEQLVKPVNARSRAKISIRGFEEFRFT